MLIQAPEVVRSSEAGATDIYVNVFNGSEWSTVELRIGEGEWAPLQHTREVDPNYRALYDLETDILSVRPGAWRELPKPGESPHLWKGRLPAEVPVGTHRLQVRTTDMFGKTFEASRVIRME
jgi:hypothetical protein